MVLYAKVALGKAGNNNNKKTHTWVFSKHSHGLPVTSHIVEVLLYVYSIYFPMEMGSRAGTTVHVMIIARMDMNTIASSASVTESQ